MQIWQNLPADELLFSEESASRSAARRSPGPGTSRVGPAGRRRTSALANWPRASPLISPGERRVQADVEGTLSWRLVIRRASDEQLLRAPQRQHPLWLPVF